MSKFLPYEHSTLQSNTHFPAHFFGIFRFTSLVRITTPVSKEDSLTTLAFTSTGTVNTAYRVSAKRSYLIFSWLHYLTTKGHSNISCCDVRIAMLPATQSFYTITKAPMAHKTRSKEQFIFKFYHFTITFKVNSRLVISSPNTSIGALAHVLVLTKQLFPIFETNLLYLKYYRVRYSLVDQSFFVYE